mmetsp:Transcript_12903/g.27867  ORF Transcript_12903/g.27867 Transcript_12903/m.27867 type:complete len:233 (-) Transcript_12903:53-751(-)
MSLSDPTHNPEKMLSSRILHFPARYLVTERSVDVELVEENEGFSIKLLVNHHSKDTHLRRTPVVQLPGPQVDHIFLISCEGSESNRECRRREITREGSLLLFPGNFQKTGSQKDGNQVLGTDLENGLVTSGKILAARETGTRPGGGVSPRRKHGNTAVLELNTTEVIEALLVAISDVSKGIPAAKLGGGGSDFVVEGAVQGRGGLGHGGGGESGGRADDGGDDGRLHDWDGR